jgi:anti-sigma B factor antagonist
MSTEPIRLEQLRSDAADRHILRLSGDLTMRTLFPFQEAVRADQAAILILDLSGVGFVDSVGVGALVGAYISRQKDGRKLALVGVGERVSASLSILGLTTLFSTFPTVEAAEKSFS